MLALDARLRYRGVMAKRSGAVHVARIVSKYKDREYVSHLLRRTYRDGGKVRHETLANLSSLPPELIEVVRAWLKGERFVAAAEAFEITRSLPHGHVAAVYGMAAKLDVAKLLGPPCAKRDLIVALIVARVCRPKSKLAATRFWADTTLGADLGVQDATTDEVYAAMDWLGRRQGAIESRLAKRHLTPGGLVLYDLSSSYVEGRCCPLAARGHSRDKKRGKSQIEYGLVTDREGRPVSIEVFAGNTGDPTAFVAAASKVKERFGLDDVVMVGDRGMITRARIKALKETGSLGWITALRAPAIKALAADDGPLQLSLFDETNLAEIAHPDYPGERLICAKNPAVAVERARKRTELLMATEAELAKIKAATTRTRRPLTGKDEIGVRVGKVVNRYKVAKHFELRITEDSFDYSRRNEAIEAEAALDGIYVIRISAGADKMSGPEAIEAYKSLARVETAFRSLKSVDLKLRPIYHHLEERVRAHALICMLAYYVVFHLRAAWAPLTFTDEEPPARVDPVAKAERSVLASKKASRRRTADGETAHSFQSLLDHLSTLTRDEITFSDTPGATIEKLAIATPTQRRAFELIGRPIPRVLA